jgi:TonB family protein
MNPLQKRCVLATASCHLLLLLILVLGPGFFRQAPPPVDLPILKVIPLKAIDAALSSGSAHVTPPPPVTPPPEPTPEPPKSMVTPEPVQPPKPEEPVTPEAKPTEEPSPVPVKPKQSKIVVDITPVKPKTQKTHADTTARDEARAARDEARKRAAAISKIARSLEHNLSSSTEVDTMPGDSSESYANYGQIVKSIYEQAWIPPDNAENDEANPKVHVVIARDGAVISAHLVEPSGDAAVDASVQRVLDRVRFIQAFPDGATEKERSYNINFNLKAKRMLE